MTPPREDGGAAFPRQTYDYYPSQNKTHAGANYPGMSLRDYFAAAALRKWKGLRRGLYDPQRPTCRV